MALQLCKLSGASLVIGVDPVVIRRELATKLGADVTLDPTQGDVGLEIRKLTDKLGADVSLEVSANSTALHQAIRATKFSGTVAVISDVAGPAAGLRLGDEFHWNAINLISCRTVSQPLRDYGWDHARIVRLGERLLLDGKIRVDGIVQPVVPFAEVQAAYQEIETRPDTSVKLGVRF
jgi:threonine dehydrogenase-like Zn-dependent dehydrogenase